MNSFLAREIVIWLILSCIVVSLPLIYIFKKIFPILLPALNSLRNSLAGVTGSVGKRITANKAARTLKKEKKKARDEAIRAAKEAETKSIEERSLYEESLMSRIDTPSVQENSSPKESEKAPREDIDDYEDTEDYEISSPDEEIMSEDSQTQETTSPSLESESIRTGSKRTIIHSSDIDQQKFQKQLESIKYAALTYKERGKPERYEKKLIEGLSLDQENQEFMNMLADHYFSTGNYVKALTLLKKIVTVQTQNHKAIRQIGRIYQAQEKPEAAQLLIEKALEQKPDHPKYLISLVEVHYEKGNKRASLEIMESLRKIRPTNIDYLLTVATLHEELNEPTFARNYYMKILELDPHNEHAKDGLKGL